VLASANGRVRTNGCEGANGRASVGVLALAVVAFAFAFAFAVAGCGSSGHASGAGSSSSSVPAYVTAPFTHEQQLVEQGARLAVADGCAACHLVGKARTVGPDFAGFAGHAVTLADGRRVLVDERFLREGLEHPEEAELKGYDAAPMLAAVKRLHLSGEPGQVAALAAFIEQIGPEQG